VCADIGLLCVAKPVFSIDINILDIVNLFHFFIVVKSYLHHLLHGLEVIPLHLEV